MGCRKIAYLLGNKPWGRDKTEKLLLSKGLSVKYKPNYRRTTYSQRQYEYPNLIEAMELRNINQVIQTDITYYFVADRFYYLTFIEDIYSRRITGYHIGSNMRAEGNISALKMALKTRKGTSLKGLIHHSDRGKQFIDKKYRKLLADNSIQMSMCKQAQENAYVERLNRTIKEEYLDAWVISDYRGLVKSVNKAVKLYNEARPHKSLQMRSPNQYEKYISSLDAEQRPEQKVFKF
jgi:transposase InsO family protein